MHHTLALVAVIACGYWLRFHAPVAEWIRDASGGALYVVAMALGLAIVFRSLRQKPRRLAALAFGLTCCVEFLQLWHPRWLQTIRSFRIGRIILGTHFSWTDFVPYACGFVLAWALLAILRKRPSKKRKGK